MLEILILIAFARKLRDILDAKGRSKGWIALGIGGWIGGELFGLILGGLLGMEDLGAYGLAVVFAAIGAGISYLVINGLAPGRGFAEDMEGVSAGVEPNLQDPSNPFNPPRR